MLNQNGWEPCDQSLEYTKMASQGEWQMFFKWAIPGLFSFIFVLIMQTVQILPQINVNKCRSSIRDLNQWPLELESSPITTRQGFAPYRHQTYLQKEFNNTCYVVFLIPDPTWKLKMKSCFYHLFVDLDMFPPDRFEPMTSRINSKNSHEPFGATIADRHHLCLQSLISCGPRFEFQAHNLNFLVIYFVK